MITRTLITGDITFSFVYKHRSQTEEEGRNTLFNHNLFSHRQFSVLSHSDHVLVYLKVIHVHVDFRLDLDVSRPQLRERRKTIRIRSDFLIHSLLSTNVIIRKKKHEKISTDRSMSNENDLSKHFVCRLFFYHLEIIATLVCSFVRSSRRVK